MKTLNEMYAEAEWPDRLVRELMNPGGNVVPGDLVEFRASKRRHPVEEVPGFEFDAKWGELRYWRKIYWTDVPATGAWIVEAMVPSPEAALALHRAFERYEEKRDEVAECFGSMCGLSIRGGTAWHGWHIWTHPTTSLQFSEWADRMAVVEEVAEIRGGA